MKYLISSLAAAALLVSCASVPQKEFDDATALRKRASRYEQVKTYENESFNVAEENYTKADDIIKEKRKKEWPDAKTALLTASENYQKVIDNGMPAYASDLKTDIDKTVKEADNLKAMMQYVPFRNRIMTTGLQNLKMQKKNSIRYMKKSK